MLVVSTRLKKIESCCDHFKLISSKIACRMKCTRIGLRYYYSTSSFNQRILLLKNAPKVDDALQDDALQLFDEMLQRQPPPSIFQFTQLMSVIVKMKQYSTALKLFKQMRLMDVPVSILTMNISINCYCRLNQVAYGFALLATLFKRGYSPSLATYSTLINGLVLADRVFEAVELFKKLLREKVCEPDQVMYGSVINGLCKVGHTSKALELLTFMESGSCKPCVEQYSVVIDSLCKDRMVDHALELFTKMTGKGVLADVITLQLFDSWSM
ncbi:putative tetratricopeptide-like helical domain superfamily [Helianthus debilis subsp. tardiflorus]